MELILHNIIINKLIDNGYEAYQTGGCVRDMLLNIEPTDYDITTNATPEAIEVVFNSDIYRVDIVGKAFLVALVNGYEVATYRKDRIDHAVPAKTFKEDASRRDFTINAMYMDEYGVIYDPEGGQEDVEKRLVRFVGNPTQRIIEDPVRTLRACRFCAYLDFSLEEDTATAIRYNAHLINDIPKERIHKEIMKVMSTCDKPSVFFEALYSVGLLHRILPEICNCWGFSGGKYHSEYIHEHLFKCCDVLPKEKPLLRLAGLFHDIGKPIVYNTETFSFLRHEIKGVDLIIEVMKRLKFSKKDIEFVSNLVLLHMRVVEKTTKPKKIRKLMADCKKLHVRWEDLLELKFADRKANRRRTSWSWKEKAGFYRMFSIEKLNPNLALERSALNVNGNDMVKIGYQGGDIKDIIDMLLKSVISNPELNNYGTLMAMAKGSFKQLHKTLG